jgi:PAS domain S-box-containing protein
MTYQTQIKDLSKIIELQQVVATSRLPLYELMTLVCQKTQELTDAAGAVVELVEAKEMVYKACSGNLEKSLGLRLNLHSSLSGLSITKNEVLHCKDSEDDERVNREACRKVGARSMICVPLIFGQPIGVLKVVSPEALKFSERDIDLLRLIGGLLSAVIAQAETDYQREVAYKMLSESENKFKMLIEAAHDGILLSKNGFAFEMNPAFCKITGFTNEEMINKPVLELVTPPERMRVQELVDAGFSEIYQTEFLKKDGSTLIVEIIGKSLMINNEEIRMSTIKDITKLKQAEEILRESIIKTNQAMKSKSEFLANISHEIRTPLNGIAGMAELLKETALNEDQSKYVRIINDSSENLMHLINGLLDFSKLEAHKMTLEKIEFNLKILLEDLTHLLIPAASRKKILLRYELDPTIPEFIYGDVTRIRQVLLNLSNNAIKFTNAGSVIIRVMSKDKNLIEFEVKDTGIGIPGKSLEEIFKPFSQVDSSITRRFGGTGLGLAISKQLVEVLKGKLTVESMEGFGSSFKFSLNLPAGEHKVQDVKSKDTLSAEKLKLMKLKILLADDSEDNRILILAYLKDLPFQINIAENGLIALEKMKTEKYDLVFMDMQMPEMDGLTATSKYRTWEKDNLATRLPIAALSAHALVEEMNKSIEAGCDMHLTKPIKKIILLNSIWDIMKNS